LLCIPKVLRCTKSWSNSIGGQIWRGKYESRASKAIWAFITFIDTSMLVGRYHYEFCIGPTQGKEGKWCHLGDCRSIDKIYTLLPIIMTDLVDKLVRLYVNEVVRLHWIPIMIVLDWDPWFTSCLWPSKQRAPGTKLNLSIVFYP
jgi:hypothetical protein